MKAKNEDKLEAMRKSHQEFMKMAKEKGYDIEKLPPLSEQERDELDTAIHNMNRTKKWQIGSK